MVLENGTLAIGGGASGQQVEVPAIIVYVDHMNVCGYAVAVCVLCVFLCIEFFVSLCCVFCGCMRVCVYKHIDTKSI